MQSLRARTRTWRGRPAVTFYSNEPTHTAPFPSICEQVLRGTLAGLPQNVHPALSRYSTLIRARRSRLARRALPGRSAGRGALCRARRALPGAARSAGRGALSRVLALQRVDTLVGRATLSRTGAAPSRAGPPWGCGQARTGLPRFLLFVPGRAYK